MVDVKTYAYGFPRIGKNREYKKVVENFCNRKNSEITLNKELMSIENERYDGNLSSKWYR